ncbi:MAG: hypothetical protein A3K68_03190 [Euryarchaeota archaeon RBG_16_68_13]|nr:MAG: hypothetical protein A3K68_03190 [Euryarchaeota archaeon RBG_16_68_13]
MGADRGSTTGRRARRGRSEPTRCAVADLFQVLGKAHMMDILRTFTQASPGPLRFVDLQRRLSLSPNTLSERLKELVETGFLRRTVYNEIPPRVDYEATEKAVDLAQVFEELEHWAARHDLRAVPLPEVRPARSTGPLGSR